VRSKPCTLNMTLACLYWITGLNSPQTFYGRLRRPGLADALERQAAVRGRLASPCDPQTLSPICCLLHLISLFLVVLRESPALCLHDTARDRACRSCARPC
jgi:hypothetical protein